MSADRLWDEFALIRHLTHRGRGENPPGVVVGIGDDAAVLRPWGGREVVACCDTMVEGVHFLRRTMRPYDVGWKLLTANLSDVAAMGGVPRFALISLGVSDEWSVEELKEVYQGIYDQAEEHQVAVVGGDTVRSPAGLFLTLTLLGEVEEGSALLRSGAAPGDRRRVIEACERGTERSDHHPIRSLMNAVS